MVYGEVSSTKMIVLYFVAFITCQFELAYPIGPPQGTGYGLATGVHPGTLKTRDWKTWDQIAGVEKAGLENTGPERMGGIHGTGKRRNKFPRWKTHDHRLLNAKWISIKLKGTLYDMYIIL